MKIVFLVFGQVCLWVSIASFFHSQVTPGAQGIQFFFLGSGFFLCAVAAIISKLEALKPPKSKDDEESKND